nr:efflux RND transporter periplasmic adaptor subunit [uncultured Halomonas sp.]
MKIIFRLVCALLFTGYLLPLLTIQAHSSEEQAQPLPQVGVARVLTQRVTEWDEYSGRLEAPETISIRPRVSGFIDAFNFEEGSRVKKGDVLFEIDPRPFETEVRRLQAQLQQSQASLESANNQARRGERLKAQQALSEEEAEIRSSTARQAEANVARVRAELDAAELDLSFTKVTAPIDGYISRAEVTAGNLVTADTTLLTTLVSSDKVYAYFEADEQAYLKYRELTRQDQRHATSLVYLGLANEDGHPHEGKMNFLDNRIDPQTGTIRGRAVFDNADGYFAPGLYARLKLVGSATYEAALIQDSAVGTDLGRKFVLVLSDDDVVEYRQITLGPKQSGLRIVREGLSGDERIVVEGLQRVRPGTPVDATLLPMADDETLAALSWP